MDVIGFVGLGHMGNPMSQQLLKAGKMVWVYDVLESAITPLKEAGANVATTLSELAEQSDIIITSLQSSRQVHDVCLQENGLFTHAKSNLLFIDCSSIDVITTRFLHDEAEKLGIGMLDAPVSGGVSGAKNATLTFMVGGDARYFERALPILNIMGKKIVHAGTKGNGQVAKICNNMLLGISMIGVCEAFNLANHLGLDPKTFFEISKNASGQCWSMTSNCPVPNIIENVPANDHYKAGFMANMMLKDLRLAHHAAESVNASTPLGALALELYELYVNHRGGEKDFSGIINFISEKKSSQ